ncbi:MAG: DNA-processing protein DprA [Candidatus Spechtbacterales bacterium]
MHQDTIKELTLADSAYPSLLREIAQPPKRLFYRGRLEALSVEPALAVVGTRRCSSYGKEAAHAIAFGLAREGVAIVSGLARGIDTAAHRAALEVGGTTVAVLGSGVDEASIYPRQNVGLARAIIEAGGIVISEYEPGAQARAYTFPERNRIVAGLTQGTVVVESPLASGSRITARLALESNRNVYAVPGSIFSRLNEGSHELIRQGALCVTSAEDVLRDINPEYQPRQTSLTFEGTAEEQAILKLIEEADEALHVDKIIQRTKLGAGEVAEALATLVLQDAIQEAGPNTYVVKK